MEVKELFDEELMSKIKHIQMKAQHLSNEVFAGEYLSAFKGRGMEFEEVREYLPGDDIRNIDWNVTARSNKPYIKTFRDERELTVVFLVDVSASARFGTYKKFKNEVAAEITALLAYTALRKNDKVGLIIFSDHVEHYIPPKKGKGHVWSLIKDILSYKSDSKKTNLNVPLEFLNRVLKKKAVTFLISDFQGEGFQRILRTTSKRHDLVAISITDPKEIELPPIGYIELEDAETGEFILVNTNDKKFLQNYKMKTSSDAKERKRFFRLNGIDFIELKTHESYFDSIVKYFKERNRKK
jgi:uncharacterized protein (DUF58 family)